MENEANSQENIFFSLLFVLFKHETESAGYIY